MLTTEYVKVGVFTEPWCIPVFCTKQHNCPVFSCFYLSVGFLTNKRVHFCIVLGISLSEKVKLEILFLLQLAYQRSLFFTLLFIFIKAIFKTKLVSVPLGYRPLNAAGNAIAFVCPSTRPLVCSNYVFEIN